MPKIHSYDPMTTADGNDVLPVDDQSSSWETKRLSLTVLKEWFQSLAGWITTNMIGNAQVTSPKIDWSTVGVAGGTIDASNATTIISGLGFKPREVEFTFEPGTATTGLYYSSGFSIDTGSGLIHRSTAAYGAGSGSGVSWRRVSSAAFSIILTNGSSTFVQGKVTNFNSDGFTVTFSTTGGVSDTFSWKARQ